MSTSLMPLPKQQYFDSPNGRPLAGGKVYTYSAGTTTPKATYTDSAGLVPQANPIVLNARGEPDNPIYWSGNYKIVLKDSSGSTIYTVDNYNADPYGVQNILPSLAASSGSSLMGFIQAGIGAFSTTAYEVFSRRVSVWDFMSPAMRADALSGSPVLDHAPAWNAAITALGGAGRVDVPRQRTASYLLKSTVNLGTSNAIDSNVVIDIEPGTPILATLPDNSTNLFSVVNVPGHFNNQGIRNLHVASTNGLGTAMKFSGQCFGSFENIYIEGFNCGIYISNAGTHIYNEFIRFTNVELHLNHTNILLFKEGTDTSMHGLSFRSTTVNVGASQVGLQMIDVCWYNGDADLKFFSTPSSEAIIKMSTSSTASNIGAFISGSISCEGSANLTGTGRFYLRGFANFDVGVNDTLTPPNAWEQGFMAHNYIYNRAYGSSGLTVAEVRFKSEEYGTTGPIASFTRLYKSGVDSLLANAYDAHTNTAGNGFYTGYTGYQKNYDTGGQLGHFLSSDGTEFKTYAPIATQCKFTHNSQYILRFDGQTRPNTTEGFFLGSGGAAVFSGVGSPEGVVTAGVGSTYQRRDGGATTTFYVKESGAGNTGWIAK